MMNIKEMYCSHPADPEIEELDVELFIYLSFIRSFIIIGVLGWLGLVCLLFSI